MSTEIVVGEIEALVIDAAGNLLPIQPDATIPASTPAVLFAGKDGTTARVPHVRPDIDGVNRVAMQGTVSVSVNDPPVGGVGQTYATPEAPSLAIATTQDSYFTIPDGKTLTVQQIEAGCEGDSTEKGSVVEAYYDDMLTLKLIARVYLNGFTSVTFPNASKTLDGTLIVGSTIPLKRFLIRRRRLSGSTQEVHAVVRGFTI